MPRTQWIRIPLIAFKIKYDFGILNSLFVVFLSFSCVSPANRRILQTAAAFAVFGEILLNIYHVLSVLFRMLSMIL